MKAIIKELIEEQEKARKKNLRHLVLMKGPLKALEIVKKIAKMFNPTFEENPTFEQELHAKYQIDEVKDQKTKHYGDVIWKD